MIFSKLREEQLYQLHVAVRNGIPPQGEKSFLEGTCLLAADV